MSLELCLLPLLSLSYAVATGLQLLVLCLHESSYSLGWWGQDCLCWADLMLPSLTMDELCAYINIYSSLVCLPFFLLLQSLPCGPTSIEAMQLFCVRHLRFCAAADHWVLWLTLTLLLVSDKPVDTPYFRRVFPFLYGLYLCIQEMQTGFWSCSHIESSTVSFYISTLRCEWQVVVYSQICVWVGSCLFWLEVWQISVTRTKLLAECGSLSFWSQLKSFQAFSIWNIAETSL